MFFSSPWIASTHTDVAPVTSIDSERVNSLEYEEEKPNLIQQPPRRWTCGLSSQRAPHSALSIAPALYSSQLTAACSCTPPHVWTLCVHACICLIYLSWSWSAACQRKWGGLFIYGKMHLGFNQRMLLESERRDRAFVFSLVTIKLTGFVLQ